MEQTNHNGALPLTEVLLGFTREAIKSEGVTALSKRLGISVLALTRAASGAPVRKGTTTVLAWKFGLLDQLGPELTGEVVE